MRCSKSHIAVFLVLLAVSACSQQEQKVQSEAKEERKKWSLVIHGGAGWITPERYDDSEREQYEKALDSALNLGRNVLNRGGSSEEAVVVAIRYLEDNPLFNAGRGSVVNALGKVEMDASIMRGSDLMAGAVAGLKHLRHPIDAARLVMNQSEHVLLSGEGAELFCKAAGLEQMDANWFVSEAMQERWLKDRNNGKFGTVGAVALDQNGVITAATSTGGMYGKKNGRIGDSPIIGAGTYADEICGISCTGHGEYFIRLQVASRVSALMTYGKLSLEQACDSVIHGPLTKMQAKGGLIAMDKRGNTYWSFNTPGMFRASLSSTDSFATIEMFSKAED
jgi:beta-aspartyl-peptidase (threonine type)